MGQSSLITEKTRNTRSFLRELLAIFDTASGHDHDGTNSKTVTATVSYGTAGEMAASGTSTANAAGTTAKTARIDHVHKVGDHDHSDNTKGNAIALAALGAGFFTANATGRAKFQAGLLDSATLQSLIAAGGFDSAAATAVFAAGAIPSAKITFGTGISVTGASSVTGDVTITGALTVSGALNWGGVTTIGNTLTVDELVLDTDGAALGVAVCGLWRDNTGDASLQAIAGKSVHLLIAGAAELSVGDVGTTLNEASNDRNFRVESGDAQYALYVDGGKNGLVVGGDTDVSDADTTVRVSSIAKTITNNNDFAHVWIQPVGSTTFLGTNAIVASLYVKEPDLTDPGAGGAATVAATVYIADAPTEGDANYALYVAAGATCIQGATVFNEASADVDWRLETNGLEYAIYADGGKDCVVIGDNTDISDIDSRLIVGNVAKTITNNDSYAQFYVRPTAATTAQGTNAVMATARFDEPNLTAGAATITLAATVYISGAPTEGSTNASLYVAAGNTTFLGVTSVLADDVSFVIGAGSDVQMRWSTADGANHAFAIGLGASKAMHICDSADIATNWNLAGDSNPALYIHGSTTPATEYIKLWTDETDAHIDAVGAIMRFDIAGTEELNLTTNALNLCASILYGSEAAHTPDTADGSLYLRSTSHATKGFVCIAAAELGLVVGSDGSVDRQTVVGTNAIHFFDGTAPQGLLTNGCSLYSAGGEAFLMDAAGNGAQQTPHTKAGKFFSNSYRADRDHTVRLHIQEFMEELARKDPTLARFVEVVKGNYLHDHP